MLRLAVDSSYEQKYLMIADYHSLTTALTYEHGRISYN